MLGLGLGAEQVPLRELVYRQAGGGDRDGGGDLQVVRVRVRLDNLLDNLLDSCR